MEPRHNYMGRAYVDQKINDPRLPKQNNLKADYQGYENSQNINYNNQFYNSQIDTQSYSNFQSKQSHRAPLQNFNDNVKQESKRTHQPPILNKYYKTQFCKKVKDNLDCPYPDRCHYAHSEEELRKPDEPFPENYITEIADAQNKYYNTHYGNYKTLICKYIQEGKQWRFSGWWLYAHSDEELRKEGTPLTNSEIKQIYTTMKEQERLQALKIEPMKTTPAPSYQLQPEYSYSDAPPPFPSRQTYLRPPPQTTVWASMPTTTKQSSIPRIFPPPPPPHNNSLLDQLKIPQTHDNKTDCSLLPIEKSLPINPENNLKILVIEEPNLSITYSLIQKTLQLIEKNFIEDARNILVYLVKQKYIEFESLIKEDDSTMDIDVQ